MMKQKHTKEKERKTRIGKGRVGKMDGDGAFKGAERARMESKR